MECMNPTACTLDSTQLVERIAEWREVSSQATSRTVEAEKIISIYPPDPQLTERIRYLIAAEAECCAFLKFSMAEGAHHTVVELAYPAEARSLVEAVVGAPVDVLRP